jgi:hypothetical protein
MKSFGGWQSYPHNNAKFILTVMKNTVLPVKTIEKITRNFRGFSVGKLRGYFFHKSGNFRGFFRAWDGNPVLISSVVTQALRGSTDRQSSKNLWVWLRKERGKS